MSRALLAATLLLGSCNKDGNLPVTTPEVGEMAPEDLLIRASLDLRGVRPSMQDFQKLEADPAAIDGLIDRYLQDPRFGHRAADLFSEVYLTRSESYAVDLNAYNLPQLTEQDFFDSVGREPLEILAHIADEDRPLTELVTGDYTLANETTELIWPIDRPRGAGWQVSHYTDGRPSAGVLATNAMWWRYTSTDSNANRKRANTTSRIFLCHDYLTRPINFDRNVDLLDEEAIDNELVNNETCRGCHQSLDPLAGYFYGFWWFDVNNPTDSSRYHPEREQQWRNTSGIAPGYYGEPGYGLADLGHKIAGDPRFPQCLTKQSFELLLRREATLDDLEALTVHREALLHGGMTLRPLFRSIIDGPEYRAGDTDREGQVPKKMVTPELLASQIEDLTGFRWTNGDWDMMTTDRNGLLTLAGGADGYYVTASARTPNPTILLVQARLAEAAAWHLATTEEAKPRLFTEVAVNKAGTEDERIAQIQRLHFWLFGRRVAADGEEVTANLELYDDLFEITDDPKRAWAGLVTALLRDPDLLFY